MAAPALLYLFINNYLPLSGIIVAFKDFDYARGIYGSDWSGLQNFRFLFKNSAAAVITRNTILYNLLFIMLNTVLGIAIAILLNQVRSRGVLKFYQTMILLPYLFSMIIISYLVFAFLSTDVGFINKGILEPAGKRAISWYNEAKYWPIILPIVNTWKAFGFQATIFYASVISIDRSYYEAAELDGASKLQQFWFITVPHIKVVVGLLVVLRTIWVFNNFDMIYLLTGGGPANATTTVPIYAYNMGWGSKLLGRSSAVTMLLLAFLLLICVVYFTIIGKWEREDK